MRQKIIFIIALLIILSIGSGLFFYNKKDEIKGISENSVNNTIPIISNSLNNIPNEIDKDLNLQKEAISKKDINFCKKMSSEFVSQNCITQVVSIIIPEAFDDTICNNLNYEMSKNQCKNTINLRLNNCDFITDDILKNNCNDKKILSQAKTLGDEKICNKLTDSILKKNCLNESILLKTEKSLDISDCDKLDIMDQSDCKMQATIKKAISLKDATYCDKLDVMLQFDCRQKVLYGIAIKEKNIGYCKNDANCLKIVSKELLEITKDKKYCEYLQNKDDCLLKIFSKKALLEQDIKICSELFGNYKNNCENFYNDTNKQLEIQ